MDNDTAAYIALKFRESIELSQSQLARVLNCSQQTISGVEKGLPISKKLAIKYSVLTGEKIEKFICE